MSAGAWEPLGRCKPVDLVDARLQLHHAAQLVAAVGKTVLEPRPDDSHPNLGWLAKERALAGHRIPGPKPFQAALRVADLQLLLLDDGGDAVARFELAGESLSTGSAWLAREIEARFERPLPAGLTSPGYEIPHHAVAGGEPFSLQAAEAFAELARYFAASDAELGALAKRTKGASEVRCWPHHFDLATLVLLETGADGSATKTVGLGLSPGDGSYAEPYFYVTPWPYPEAAVALPALPSGGHWHREGFTAAILTGSALVDGGPAGRQAEGLREFLAGAEAACRRVHGL